MDLCILIQYNYMRNRNLVRLKGLIDVKADPNRKDTAKIVDFLRDKCFVGGVRPVVYVHNYDRSRGYN